MREKVREFLLAIVLEQLQFQILSQGFSQLRRSCNDYNTIIHNLNVLIRLLHFGILTCGYIMSLGPSGGELNCVKVSGKVWCRVGWLFGLFCRQRLLIWVERWSSSLWSLPLPDRAIIGPFVLFLCIVLHLAQLSFLVENCTIFKHFFFGCQESWMLFAENFSLCFTFTSSIWILCTVF